MSMTGGDWPEKISLVTWSEAGAASNRGWAELLAADISGSVEVAIEPDLVKRFRGVGSGAYDLVPGFSNETSLMLAADKAFADGSAGPYEPAIVWSYSRSNSGFFVRGGAPIHCPQDIRPGTRIVDPSSFLGVRVYDALLAWAGVSRDDIDWVPVGSTQEIVAAVSEGRADIAFAIPTSPTSRAAEESPPGIHWIELNSAADPDGAARFQAVYPLVHFGVIPNGDVASATGTWGTESINYLIRRAGDGDDLAYRLADWFDANQPRFAAAHPDNRFRTREILLEGLKHTFIPCHAGLIRYLGERGLWSAAHEKRQMANRELAARYRQAFAEALEQAATQGVDTAADNPAWINLWSDWKQKHNLPEIKVFAGLPVD
jgi:uncharacterized protein